MTDALNAMCAAYHGDDWWPRQHPMAKDDCRRQMRSATLALAGWFEARAKAGERCISYDIAARAIREAVG